MPGPSRHPSQVSRPSKCPATNREAIIVNQHAQLVDSTAPIPQAAQDIRPPHVPHRDVSERQRRTLVRSLRATARRAIEADHRARAIVAALMAGLVAVAGAGCGGTSHSQTPDLGLGAYLIRGDEETGFHTTGAPATSTTASLWTAGIPDGQAEKSRLKTEGFHRAISVQTASAHGQGVSWVMELGSIRDAVREQTAELREFIHVPGPVERFTVPGVRTAEGFTYPGPNPQDANALVREGRCLLLVGDQESANDYRAPVIAAVRAIWTRTNKNKGACTR